MAPDRRPSLTCLLAPGKLPLRDDPPLLVSLMSSSVGYCDSRLAENSIYSLLYRESHRLFPALPIYLVNGRRSAAIVMVLQPKHTLDFVESVAAS